MLTLIANVPWEQCRHAMFMRRVEFENFLFPSKFGAQVWAIVKNAFMRHGLVQFSKQ